MTENPPRDGVPEARESPERRETRSANENESRDRNWESYSSHVLNALMDD